MDCTNWIVLNLFDGSYRLNHIGIGIGLIGFAQRNWLFVICLVLGNWLATGWMGRMDWTGRGWYRVGIEGPTLAGTIMGAPPLALEGRRVAVSGGCHQLRRYCKGA